MTKKKVVVTDWEYADLRYEKEILDHEDIDLIPAQCKTEEDVIEIAKDADGMINQYAPISQRVLDRLERCQIITRYGVGVNTIDIEAATEKGICVANVPDYCKDEVADHALALLMAWTRKVIVANHYVKNKVWDFKVTQPIYRLRGKVLGLVGFGMIPQSLAEKVKPLGLQVVAHDPFVPESVARDKGVSLVTLEELCQQSDFLSVHAPLLASTTGMIGRDQFAKMKETAILINTSRGPVVDEQALIEALQTKKIAGAALDVVEEEPIPSDHPFLDMEQVILTPHVAWYSEESARELRYKAAMGVMDVLVHKELPRYLVNRKVIPKKELKPSQAEERYKKLVMRE